MSQASPKVENMSIAGSLLASAAAADEHVFRTFGRLVGAWSVRNRLRALPTGPWTENERTWIFS